MQKATTNQLKAFSLVLITGTLLLLSSCKKDPETNPVPPPQATGNKIKEYKNGDEFVRFTYNPDGTIKKATVKNELSTLGEVIDFNISYNAEKKITEVITSLGEKIVPEYEDNVMIRASFFDGPVRTSYTNYHYEAGAVKRATIYLNMGADFEPFLDFEFTYGATENITQTVVMTGTGVPGQMVRAGHVTMQHDQKINPLFQHRDFMALLWQGVSKNNVIREEHFDQDLNLEDIYTYVYTYKTNGLPEKATVTSGLPGQTPVTSDLDFIYQ